MKELPNTARNKEVQDAIKNLDGLDLGAQSSKHTSIAQTVALLNVAESLQLVQLQIIETSSENRKATENAVNKLIESNNEASQINKSAIRWSKGLTVALIVVTLIVGLLQAYVIWKTAEIQQVSAKSSQIVQNPKQ
jgi:hypothetical protein